jgi:type I restriction enzyme S subunit
MSERIPSSLSDLPPDWEIKSIGQLATRVGSGVTPTGGSEVYTESGITFIRSQNVTNDGLLLDDVAYIDPATHERMSASEVLPFDVLLNITGASIGRCCFVPDDLGPANANQHVCTVRLPGVGSSDAKFLCSVLVSHIGQRQINLLNAGGNREGLNYQQLRSFVVPWPQPQSRAKIATILSTLDEVIEATEKLVEKHQQIKAGLMHDLFTRGLWTRPELARGDHHGLPCQATAQAGQLRPTPADAPGLYQESPLGLIPKGWQIVTTLDCASESPGSTTIGPFGSDLVSADYQSEGIPVVFVRDVKSTGFEWNSEVYVSSEKAFRLSAHAVRPGDILSSKMGLPPCISCTYPDWMPDGIITADMIRLRPDLSKITSQWLSAALNGDAFKRQVQTITAGVTRPKVTLSDFRKLRLARPLLEEQKLIDTLLTRHENVLSANHQHLAKLRQQKQGLMHDLLTGRVRVDVSSSATVPAES